MSEKFSELSPALIDFIGEQHIYFVGTAGAEGRVNVSPKGMDSLRILGPNDVVWLNMTGSGNETAAHVLENQRMTIMFCSFGKQPLILRLYGQAQVIHPRDADWDALITQFNDYVGARQIFRLAVDLVQTSCGYAVPHCDYKSERITLEKWAEKRSREGVEAYWAEKNTQSLDGKDTGILP
ncbi:pyridoxamine 5'-phosphate oxidase family protein [Pseudohongiella sp.]|uniref:Pyridoxamine 5'-phosphate oxidase N-terminal domain-containing protein n=1 Tax=marine sediment metagenome TaxID=412755 RepID=A0A0F9YVY1_9ZZZZ|nr:pyridoxamine 5'-phosphate oxidase family protein [Pseudohongiella sp.]HDZ07957.1 pyridoxamine 5'-phosphate oxidase family protein [Pseudohongiella sp.]HEA64436.1 pyridoxamine 5'-phosphate oxidase family protein [Pseudohongiella sp.]